MLLGRVAQRGDNLSIRVELVDVGEDRHLWGGQYNRKLADILAVQEDISREISEKLRLRLTGEEKKRLAKRSTENTEAYQLYLKGRYYTAKSTREGLNKGVEYFHQAIATDPNYALAFVGLAYYYWTALEWTLSPRESMPKAREAASKALQIDDTLAEAHAWLGVVSWVYDWDWSAGEKEFKRAIELNPNLAVAHSQYAFYLAVMGRVEEATAESKRAQDLDPVSPETNMYTGWILYFAHRYSQAIEQLRKTVDLDPNYWFAHTVLGVAYEGKGELPEAIAEFEKARQLEDTIPENWGALGHAYAVSGKRAEALTVLEKLKELSKEHYVPPFDMAIVYVGLGEKDRAFEWLEKAYAERSFFLTWLKVEPELDSLRSDPRFADLVRRVGLWP